MIQLQVEVGRHEVGELVVVVLLVDLEQLRIAGRHDGEALLAQLLAQLRVKFLQLRWVQQVLHVHAQPLGNVEVLLLQLGFARLHALDEGLLHVVVLQHVVLLDGSHVGVAPALLSSNTIISESYQVVRE